MDDTGPELLTRLVAEHGAALVLYARQWCAAPEDVVQEALVRLMGQQPLPHNPVGWLYRTVRNEAINASRSANRRTRHETAAAQNSKPWFTALPDESLDAAAATQALAALEPEERETIVLRVWSKLSFEEIAELMGTSKSTAHRRFLTGLAALRERLEKSCTNSNRPTR